ncbi:MAG TPA: flagellar hook-basal body complex protein, partial [Gemmatirosa sp.]
MLRSLFDGVSGLRNQQTRMDVIGNNIANVNTVAFKAGRVTFKEGFAQLLQGASRPPGDQGGTNPIQIGLGSEIGSIDQIYTQGNLETTGNATDLAIQGDSMFVVRKGAQSSYTRSGNFQVDSDGKLVSPTNGFVVQGQMYKNGVAQDGVQDITIPFGQKVAAKATDAMTLGGNLNASATKVPPGFDISNDADRAANPGSWSESTLTTYDSLGDQHDVKIQMWKTDANQWAWRLDPSSPSVATPATIGSADPNGAHHFSIPTPPAGSTVTVASVTTASGMQIDPKYVSFDSSTNDYKIDPSINVNGN